MGADLSYVNEIEDHSGIYKDSGISKDPFLIFKNHGANVVRVRLWHNPQWVGDLNNGKLYSDLKDVEKTMSRAKSFGLAVNLDLHYSDEWADPGHQLTPAAWNNLDLPGLKDSVYQYTLFILNYFKSKNLIPEMIQIGNETNQGMLFPVGKVEGDNWINFGELLKSGIKAVRDFSVSADKKPQIILHVAQLKNADWWVDNVTMKGGVSDFDILGISHYYVYDNIITMNEIGNSISALRTKYNKKVMIVETAYPWTNQSADSYTNVTSGNNPWNGYPVSKESQYNYIKDLTQQVISAGGVGVMYWEPAWITSSMKDKWGTGSSWENNAMFDFQGNALPAMDYMNYAYKF